ncbi:hypothetical protein [Aliarcobacter vitoriensis]|uniref:Uncharacterized protein n=1 Tax=Aliarcobacter vitoriensis TaxID=2011099 RepID=A0A366MT13_9BACT|nr:hypothetical protein [Aliarcobacter vitoriensis]RBQ28522.1 hypothetical protein CRU91_08375 [Aliarcobacter vitoriensis]RBQ31824.1 hypothetical protein CRU92_06355 [Arcobacter sp. FW59]
MTKEKDIELNFLIYQLLSYVEDEYSLQKYDCKDISQKQVLKDILNQLNKIRIIIERNQPRSEEC